MRLPLCLGLVAVLAPLTAAAVNDSGGHQEATYHGGLVTPPLPKPKFTLTDTSGNPFDFWTKTQGYVTLLFFGYTQCADVCPVQMSTVAGALHKLPKRVQEQFKVVFVTVDPAHDQPKVLRAWLNHFDSRYTGLSGTPPAVKAAQVAANIPAAHGTTDHAAFVLAYTRDNLGHVIYPEGIAQADLATDLPRLAQETWPAAK